MDQKPPTRIHGIRLGLSLAGVFLVLHLAQLMVFARHRIDPLDRPLVGLCLQNAA